jgi:hypothetical protein
MTATGTGKIDIGGTTAMTIATTGLTLSEATIDGKLAAVGTSASTGIMIATGSTTNAGTVTFGAVFGATPTITLGVQGAATNAVGSNAVARVTSKNSTNCVIFCDGFVADAAATVDVIAVGTRP